jgi:hypothetical protein
MTGMHRRRVAAWLSSLPLMVAGSQAAHVLAYRWVYPNAHARLGELLSTGHAYMGSGAYLPMLLGMIFAAELVGLGGVLVAGIARRPQRPVAAWAFALLPILAFTLQELLERWLSSSSFPWWMVLQPAFRVGVLLQLPFALAAYLLARLLLRTAVTVGRALRGALPPARPTGRSPGWVVLEACSPALGALASGHSGRGPPRAAAAA